VKKKLCAVFFVLVVFFCLSGTVLAQDELGEVKELIKKYYLEDVDQSILGQMSVNEMVYALNDPYSNYIEPDHFKDFLASLDGKYTGVGMYITQVEDTVRVASPMPGSPAEKAGLQAGDIIISVNGASTRELSSSEVAAKIRGPEGSQVKIKVKRGNETLEFTVTRQTIQVPSLEYRLISPNMGYIKLYSFTSDAPEEMNKALDDLTSQGAETLILDLRDNPGGLLDTAVSIAGNFVPKGPVVHVIQKGNREYSLKSFKIPRGLPTAVLVNGGTASAAEILAGAIQDAKTGFLIGTKTYGKGCVQTIFTLSDGAGLKITTAKYLTRSRQDINLKGLTPDLEEKDEEKQLERAIKRLGGAVPYDFQMTLNSRKVFVGYHTYDLPESPIIINGRVFVPLRSVAGYLGGSIRWEQGQATVVLPQNKLIIDPNKGEIFNQAKGTGVKEKILIKNGCLMVPIRIFAEELDYKIDWKAKLKQISISH